MPMSKCQCKKIDVRILESENISLHILYKGWTC